MMTVIKLRTNHDESGNPQRLFLVFHEGSLVRGYDEGYEGEHVMPESFRKYYAGEVIDVTESEYAHWLGRVETMMERHSEERKNDN